MYISLERADAILEGEGHTQNWGKLSDVEKGEFLTRASRRIEQLAFNPQHENPRRPRYENGLRNQNLGGFDIPIPAPLELTVALLALWYAQNPESLYNFVRQSLSAQLSDLPLPVQSGLWPYLASSVKTRNIEAADEAQSQRTPAHSLNYEGIRAGTILLDSDKIFGADDLIVDYTWTPRIYDPDTRSTELQVMIIRQQGAAVLGAGGVYTWPRIPWGPPYNETFAANGVASPTVYFDLPVGFTLDQLIGFNAGNWDLDRLDKSIVDGRRRYSYTATSFSRSLPGNSWPTQILATRD